MLCLRSKLLTFKLIINDTIIESNDDILVDPNFWLAGLFVFKMSCRPDRFLNNIHHHVPFMLGRRSGHCIQDWLVCWFRRNSLYNRVATHILMYVTYHASPSQPQLYVGIRVWCTGMTCDWLLYCAFWSLSCRPRSDLVSSWCCWPCPLPPSSAYFDSHESTGWSTGWSPESDLVQGFL